MLIYAKNLYKMYNIGLVKRIQVYYNEFDKEVCICLNRF